MLSNGTPPALLELWGRLAYVLGLLLVAASYGRFTFRPGGRWGLGRERQNWDLQALIAMGLTLALVPLMGYVGSGVVLVEGAQTLECLKDVAAILAIVLFGFPAMLAVPPAYMVSDVIEGVPPEAVLGYFDGYLIWAAFGWVAYQLIGREPDFRRLRTWGAWALVAVMWMLFHAPAWGYVCSVNFPDGISYSSIVPAVWFTYAADLLIAPVLLLALFPLARRCGLFWRDIPGHVRQRSLGQRWSWQSGPGGGTLLGEAPASEGSAALQGEASGVPVRIVMAGTLVSLLLVLVGAVAYLTLDSAKQTADQLVSRLHQEISENINLRLDDYMERGAGLPPSQRAADIHRLLSGLPVAEQGLALVLDDSGRLITDSQARPGKEAVAREAIAQARSQIGPLGSLKAEQEFRFVVVTARPLSRENWLARATRYSDNARQVSWVIVTAMPESYYLAPVREGGSRTAMLSAVALSAALALAALLAAVVVTPIQRISQSIEAMAAGHLGQHVGGSHLLELDALGKAFNRMAAQLQAAFKRTASSEQTLKTVFNASPAAMVVFNTSGIAPGQADVRTGLPVADVNSAWQRITGYRPEDVVGHGSHRINSWADERDRQRFYELLARDGQVDEFEAQHRRVSGELFVALISLRQAQVGDGQLAVLAMEDITERKRADERLHELNQQLDQRVRERTAELQAMLERLQRTQARLVQSEKLASLGAIVAAVAHELNTPIGVSVTVGSTLEGETQAFSRAMLAGNLRRAQLDAYVRGQQEGLALLMRVLMQAGELVSNFKRVAVGQGESHRRQRFVLKTVLEQQLPTIRIALGSGSAFALALEVPEDIAMDSFPGALEQLLTNLVNNSVKHGFAGRAGGRMQLAAQLQGEQVHIVFSDDGVGMSAEVRHRIFDPFFTTALGQGGSGLGMAISYTLVTGPLGGSIEVASEPGQGARFTIILPCVAPPEPETAAAQAPQQP